MPLFRGGGGVILGEVKARPKDIISFSLDYISKSKIQTSNPSSSPISLDTPARPADFPGSIEEYCRAEIRSQNKRQLLEAEHSSIVWKEKIIKQLCLLVESSEDVRPIHVIGVQCEASCHEHR